MGDIEMCLLIVKPVGVKVPHGLCARATHAHPDGWGVAWSRDGECHAVKNASVSVEDQITILDSIVDAPAIVHWRFATHGPVCFANAHPFGLADGGFAAHNGVLRGYGSKDRSDTRHFVDEVLSLYRGAADIEDDRQYLDRMIQGSRIATIHPDGSIVRLGSGWIRGRSGILASNRSGFGSRTPRAHSAECDLCAAPASTYRLWCGEAYAVCLDCAKQGDRHYGR